VDGPDAGYHSHARDRPLATLAARSSHLILRSPYFWHPCYPMGGSDQAQMV
jgi:hypothetical protein